MSDLSVGSTMRSNIAVQDMFGNPEVEKYKANPVKGKKYLAFTIFMVIVLSIVVINNSNRISLDDIAKANIADDQRQTINLPPTPDEGSSKPPKDESPKTEPSTPAKESVDKSSPAKESVDKPAV